MVQDLPKNFLAKHVMRPIKLISGKVEGEDQAKIYVGEGGGGGQKSLIFSQGSKSAESWPKLANRISALSFCHRGGGGGGGSSLLSILTERYLWSCRPLTSHIFCALFCLPPVHT